MKPMKIFVKDWQCGAGKTYASAVEMATIRKCYIYVVDRIEQMDQREKMIRERAAAAGVTSPPIYRVFQDHSGKSVKQDIERLASDYHAYAHVVVMITSVGMKMTADWAAFTGWHMIIDEDPSLFSFKREETPVSGNVIDQWFNITNLPNTDISVMEPQPNVNAQRFRRDTFASGAAELRQAMETSTVMTCYESMEKMAEAKRWAWFTFWDLTRLAPFERVTILANAFKHKLSYKLTVALYGKQVRFVFEQPPAQRTNRDDRPVTIRYFTDQHEARRSFFETLAEKGEDPRKNVWEWIAAQHDPEDKHLWVTNSHFTVPMKINGVQGTGKMTGDNSHQERNVVSVIYSAKGSKDEIKAIGALSHKKLKAGDVTRDRELEDLAQIVLRSSLRDPKCQSPVEFRVYDRVQAAFLKGFLTKHGYSNQVSEVYTDVGINHLVNAKVGRPPLNGIAMTVAERKREQRARDALLGIVRPR